MADIFMSYASEDRSRAETFAKTLEEQGWSVWWDKTIPPGKTFDQVIQEAIESARCVVVLWSKKSINSDWVKEEANIGKERKILVPAKIDPVELPIGFGRIQAADLTNWEAEKEHPGFFSLLNAISDIVGPRKPREKGEQSAEIPESRLKQQSEVQYKAGETPQLTQRQTESTKVKPPEPKPDAKVTTEPKSPEPRKTSNALKYSAAAGVILLLIAGIWWRVTVQGGGSIEPPSVEKTSVTVSAKYSSGIDRWFDTHFNVKTGSILSIETKGKWTLGGGPRTCDANGLTNFSDYNGFPPGTLLGRIGENGRVFAVGKAYKSTVYDPGRLYLSNNDRNVKDNSGALEVTIRTWSKD